MAAIVLGLIAIVGWATRVVDVPLDVMGLALLTCAVALVPLFLWVRSGEDTIPMFAILCLSFGMHYGFTVFSQPNMITIQSEVMTLAWSTIRETQLMALVGLVALIAGAYLPRLRAIQSRLPAIDLPLRADLRWFAIFFFAGLSLISPLVAIVGGARLGAVHSVLSAMAQIAVALATQEIFRQPHKPQIPAKALLYAYLGFLFVTGMRSGMLENAFLPLMVHLVVRCGRSRQIPVALLGVLAVSIAVLNAVKMEVRTGEQEGWTSAVRDLSASEFAGVGEGAESQGRWRSLVSRFALMNRTAWVATNTPDVVPHFDGASYKYAVYTPVPRILWPGKPNISDATAMLDYGYRLRSMSGSENIGIGFIAEAYANFGWAGIPTVLFVQGLILGLLGAMLNRSSSEGGAAIYVVLMVPFLNGIGTSSVMMYGIIVPATVLCTVLVFPFSGRFTNSPRPHDSTSARPGPNRPASTRTAGTAPLPAARWSRAARKRSGW